MGVSCHYLMVNNVNDVGRVKRENALEHAQNTQIHACAKYHPGLSSFMHSVVSYKSVSGQ